MKFNAIEEGHLPLPVMANRKQNYLMTGIPTLKDTVDDIKFKKNSLEVKWSKEVLNLFYNYFLDEKERVLAAHRLRDEYNSPETSKERKATIKETFIKNYHYTGDLDLSKGGAYKFIHFKAFNSYKILKT